jgi:hypothetical protein
VRIVATSPADRRPANTRFRPTISNAAVTAGVITAIVFGFAGTTRAQMPNINIEETCRAAAHAMVSLMGGTLSQNDFDLCMDSEKKAHQQILAGWATFEASDRAGCVRPKVHLPSYVEWFTCFEMNKTVRDGSKARGIQAADPKAVVTLPKLGIRY